MMKRFLSLVLSLMLMLLSFVSCSRADGDTGKHTATNADININPVFNSVEIPNVIGVDSQTAKTALVALGIIPIEKEAYSWNYKKGYIDSVEPSVGTSIEKGSNIIIYVSKGFMEMYPVSVNGTARFNKGEEAYLYFENQYEGWNISGASIREGTLRIAIELQHVACEYYYSDRQSETDLNALRVLSSSCAASLDSEFNVSVPASCAIIYSNESTDTYPNPKSNCRYITYGIEFTVSLEALSVEAPLTVYIKMPFEYAGEYRHEHYGYKGYFTINCLWNDPQIS